MTVFPDKNTEKLFNLTISQPPEKSDVIVWLQGDCFDRGEKVLELYKNKFALKILISGNNVRIKEGGDLSGGQDVSLGEIKAYLVKRGVSDADILIDDQSLATNQHPINVRNLAKENNWKKIIIVSSPYHQLRAFLSFVKIFKNENNIKIINQTADHLDWENMVGGKEQTHKELLKIELEKIKKYADDLASVEEGLEYIKK